MIFRPLMFGPYTRNFEGMLPICFESFTLLGAGLSPTGALNPSIKATWNAGHFFPFLNYLFRPNFDQLYSLHPDFGGEFAYRKSISNLIPWTFCRPGPTNSEVQRLAAQFALPLGLVSQLDGLFELNLTITPPAFLTYLVQNLENLGATERPIESLFELVRRSPFGLDKNALSLILLALVADGQIELFDPESNLTLGRETLASIDASNQFSHFRRIPFHKDYPSEILTQWCRLITGRQDLTDISTSSGTRSRSQSPGRMASELEEPGHLAAARDSSQRPVNQPDVENPDLDEATI